MKIKELIAKNEELIQAIIFFIAGGVLLFFVLGPPDILFGRF